MHISNDPSVISHPIQKAVDSTIDVIRKNIQCGTFKNMFPSRHNNDNGNMVPHRHGNRIHRPAEDIQDRTALQNSVAEYDVLGEGNLPLRRRGRLRGRILQPVIIEPVIISDTKTSVLPGGEESFVNPLRVRSLM
ncbi:F-box only protein [Trichinella spiralis]|uniref:F-box only protein n=1 Tax=Trichinella spiralis TaxID=6334 RepID=A0ABR3K7N5_TRISP